MSRKRAGLDQKLIEVCNRLGWVLDIDQEDGMVELRQASPAGEDFSIEVDIIGFVSEVATYADSFDEERHVKMWLDAKEHGVSGVPSIRELLDDADDIKKMLTELAEELQEVEAA